jgi:hypothetical protein
MIFGLIDSSDLREQIRWATAADFPEPGSPTINTVDVAGFFSLDFTSLKSHCLPTKPCLAVLSCREK